MDPFWRRVVGITDVFLPTLKGVTRHSHFFEIVRLAACKQKLPGWPHGTFAVAAKTLGCLYLQAFPCSSRLDLVGTPPAMEPWFDYTLPPELIAQEPLSNRVDARLMVIDRARQTIDHAYIRDLPDYIRRGDRVVLNDTKVVPAQLRGVRIETGGRWQGLFLGARPDGDWTLVCKTRGHLKEPEAVNLLDREGRVAVRLFGVTDQDELAVLVRHLLDEAE